MRKVWLLVGVVLYFLSILFLAPPSFASAVDAANAGMKALEQGDRKKAKVLFKSALASNELSKENFIIVNNQLCGILRSESKHTEALACYSESLYLRPDDPVALLARGGVHHQLGDYQRAVEDLGRYTRVRPRDPEGFVSRALAWRSLKNYDRAIADLGHAIWLGPSDAVTHIHRGHTYLKTRNYNLALADFETAVKIDPENPYGFQSLAWVYAACPNRDFRDGARAVKLARKAVELGKETSDPVFPATLAAAYAEQGRFHDAVAVQKQAISRLKKTGRAGLSKEELNRRLGLYEQGHAYQPE